MKNLSKTPVLEESLWILVDMGNEVGKALEDNKIKTWEYVQIAMPLLRVPKVLSQANELRSELQKWVSDSNIRISLVESIAERLEIDNVKAEAVIRETLVFNRCLEAYIENLKTIFKGDPSEMGAYGLRSGIIKSESDMVDFIVKAYNL